MKWIYRLLTIAMLGGAVLFPFFMKDHKGEPMFSLPEAEDFVPASLSSDDTLPSLPSSAQTFYKWQDEQGTWHYGDTPPIDGPRFSTIEIDSNTNVIQSVAVEPTLDQKMATSPSPGTKSTTPDLPDSNILSLERAMNVLNDAQNVQNLMNNHNAQLEAINSNNNQ